MAWKSSYSANGGTCGCGGSTTVVIDGDTVTEEYIKTIVDACLNDAFSSAIDAKIAEQTGGKSLIEDVLETVRAAKR